MFAEVVFFVPKTESYSHKNRAIHTDKQQSHNNFKSLHTLLLSNPKKIHCFVPRLLFRCLSLFFNCVFFIVICLLVFIVVNVCIQNIYSDFFVFVIYVLSLCHIQFSVSIHANTLDIVRQFFCGKRMNSIVVVRCNVKTHTRSHMHVT